MAKRGAVFDAAGAVRIRAKMAEAISLAKLYGTPTLDRALGSAALAGRFGEADLGSILGHQRSQASAGDGETIRAPENRLLQPGTAAWPASEGRRTNS